MTVFRRSGTRRRTAPSARSREALVRATARTPRPSYADLLAVPGRF